MILIETSHNGSSISGEAVMLSRYGEVYPTIDNKYHPNPGLKEEGYPEIERTVDWLYRNGLSDIFSKLDDWVMVRVARILAEGEFTEYSDIVKEVFYSDTYSPCQKSLDSVKNSLDYFDSNLDEISRWNLKSEIEISEKIVKYLNEKFLRVRAGGKLNPEGANAIYFRISSHGYDWHSTISDFLWDTFGGLNKMPRKIWIGHDAETNPPETTLFEGPPEDLFEGFDNLRFESRSTRKFI